MVAMIQPFVPVADPLLLPMSAVLFPIFDLRQTCRTITVKIEIMQHMIPAPSPPQKIGNRTTRYRHLPTHPGKNLPRLASNILTLPQLTINKIGGYFRFRRQQPFVFGLADSLLFVQLFNPIQIIRKLRFRLLLHKIVGRLIPFSRITLATRTGQIGETVIEKQRTWNNMLLLAINPL